MSLALPIAGSGAALPFGYVSYLPSASASRVGGRPKERATWTARGLTEPHRAAREERRAYSAT